MTQALAQFVLDHDGAIVASWDEFKGEVVYKQEKHRPAEGSKESSTKTNSAGRLK
jgi:hypothetical protein